MKKSLRSVRLFVEGKREIVSIDGVFGGKVPPKSSLYQFTSTTFIGTLTRGVTANCILQFRRIPGKDNAALIEKQQLD